MFGRLAAVVLGVLIVATVAGAAPLALGWHKIAETDTTVTYGWTPNPQSVGYRFFVNGARVSNTADPMRDSVRFAKVADGRYGILELLPGAFEEDGGISPPPPPPPPPEPPPPPPPPPPVFNGDCRVSNYQLWEPEDCNFGSTVSLTNQGWSCPANVTAYPVRVRIASTGRWAGNASTFDNGCRNPAGWDADRVAFIVLVEGTGLGGGTGAGADMFKFRPFAGPGPGPITMTVRGDCGPPSGGAHPDFMQNQAPQGAGPIVVVNARSGNYDSGVPTCQAAGGMFFWSSGADIRVVGAKVIGCNHGLNGGESKHGSGSAVIDSQFRTGSDSHPNCGSFSVSDPCINTQGMALQFLVCQRRVNGQWVNVAPRS